MSEIEQARNYYISINDPDVIALFKKVQEFEQRRTRWSSSKQYYCLTSQKNYILKNISQSVRKSTIFAAEKDSWAIL